MKRRKLIWATLVLILIYPSLTMRRHHQHPQYIVHAAEIPNSYRHPHPHISPPTMRKYDMVLPLRVIWIRDEAKDATTSVNAMIRTRKLKKELGGFIKTAWQPWSPYCRRKTDVNDQGYEYVPTHVRITPSLDIKVYLNTSTSTAPNAIRKTREIFQRAAQSARASGTGSQEPLSIGITNPEEIWDAFKDFGIRSSKQSYEEKGKDKEQEKDDDFYIEDWSNEHATLVVLDMHLETHGNTYCYRFGNQAYLPTTSSFLAGQGLAFIDLRARGCEPILATKDTHARVPPPPSLMDYSWESMIALYSLHLSQGVLIPSALYCLPRTLQPATNHYIRVYQLGLANDDQTMDYGALKRVAAAVLPTGDHVYIHTQYILDHQAQRMVHDSGFDSEKIWSAWNPAVDVSSNTESMQTMSRSLNGNDLYYDVLVISASLISGTPALLDNKALWTVSNRSAMVLVYSDSSIRIETPSLIQRFLSYEIRPKDQTFSSLAAALITLLSGVGAPSEGPLHSAAFLTGLQPLNYFSGSLSFCASSASCVDTWIHPFYHAVQFWHCIRLIDKLVQEMEAVFEQLSAFQLRDEEFDHWTELVHATISRILAKGHSPSEMYPELLEFVGQASIEVQSMYEVLLRFEDVLDSVASSHSDTNGEQIKYHKRLYDDPYGRNRFGVWKLLGTIAAVFILMGFGFVLLKWFRSPQEANYYNPNRFAGFSPSKSPLFGRRLGGQRDFQASNLRFKKFSAMPAGPPGMYRSGSAGSDDRGSTSLVIPAM